MKNNYCSFLFLLITLTVFSQEKIEEGFYTLKHYGATEEASTESLTYFKGNRTRAEHYNAIEGETIQISDSKTKDLLILMNHPQFGKKYKLQKMIYSDDEKKKYNVTKGSRVQKFLGYDCNQYLIKIGNKAEVEIFSTEAIEIPSNSSNDIFGNLIKGFIMYTKFSYENFGTKVEKIVEVIKITKEKVADDKFELTPPIGYSEIK